MKNNKIILILTILLITLCINTTSATDDQNNNDTTITDISLKNPITKNTTKEIKKDEIYTVTTYKQLSECIKDANANKTNKIINLEKGNYTVTESIEIKGKQPINITINGNGNIINATDKYNFITIQKSNGLNINNITITNTNYSSGSCMKNYGNVNMNHVQIINNYASSDGSSSSGGSIFNSGTLYINNSLFYNNTYKTNTFGGGAIHNYGILSINNTIFENNTSKDGSAIYGLNGYANITNCTFKYNNADYSTIYNFNAKIIINNSMFYNNYANNSPIIYTLDKGENLINNCTFTNHTSDNNLLYNNYKTTLTNCIIYDNKADYIISNDNNITLTNNTINKNSASLILNNYISLIENCNITYNNISKALIENNYLMNISYSNFTNNTSQHIIKDIAGLSYITYNNYLNNSCEELFEGTVNNIKASYNTYLGNNLPSYININNTYTFLYNESILIKQMVQTRDVYNTTTNGYITIYQNDNLLTNSNMTNSQFILNLTNKLEKENKLILYYDGNANFKNNSIDMNIIILYPEYVVDIITDKNSYNYNDIINYTVSVNNTGLIDIDKIILNNIIPSNVILCNNSYNLTNNTLIITDLHKNTTKLINLLLNITSKDNITFQIQTSDDYSIIKAKTVHILNPSLTITVDDNLNDDICITDQVTLNINVENLGNGSTGQINLNINYNNINISNIKLNPIYNNSKIELPIELLINKTGKSNINITITDEIFNTSYVKNYEFNVKKPEIIIDEVNSFVNDIVNFTAYVKNINNLMNSSIVFKVNSLTIYNHTVLTNNNTITLINFIIPSNWSKNRYTLEIKLFKKGFENILTNYTNINLRKLSVYSEVFEVKSLMGNKINLTAIFIDEFNNKINQGQMKFKINGKTINQTIKIIDGKAELINFIIPETFKEGVYNLSIVYGENSRYLSNRNHSTLTLEKLDSYIIITNTTYTRRGNFSMFAEVYCINNTPANGGKVVFKINNKTVSEVIPIVNGKANFTFVKGLIRYVNSVTVVYSGNTILRDCRNSTVWINNRG